MTRNDELDRHRLVNGLKALHDFTQPTGYSVDASFIEGEEWDRLIQAHPPFVPFFEPDRIAKFGLYLYQMLAERHVEFAIALSSCFKMQSKLDLQSALMHP